MSSKVYCESDKKCHSYPNCRNDRRCKKVDCHFNHPNGRFINTNCRDDKICKRANCHFNHPNGRFINTNCRNDKKCKRKNCHFNHPHGKNIDEKNDAENKYGVTEQKKNDDLTQLCGWDTDCENDNCKFSHPNGKKKHCHNWVMIGGDFFGCRKSYCNETRAIDSELD
jgi:hypothetical protein